VPQRGVIEPNPQRSLLALLYSLTDVPHPDYAFKAAVLTACSGPAWSAPSCEGPAGTFASKAKAQLKYAVADVEGLARGFYGAASHPIVGKVRMQHKITLQETTRQELIDAIADANDRLNAHNHESRGGTFDFYFSGHGRPNGDLCLADGPFSPDELAECWVRGNTGREMRHIRLMLDCCHAGMTLARLYLHPGHWGSYVLRDAWAASLPSQEAFELPKLGHGVFTYTRLRPDPLSIMNKIRDEEREPTAKDIKALRKAEKETTQFLTNGAQHALNMINGHHVSVVGLESRPALELEDQTSWSLDQLVAAFDALTSRRPR
jgi:uncharacterized caspase-like protein